MIGLLFASFGLTLLVLSIPMGALSDPSGAKGPMIFGLALLALARRCRSSAVPVAAVYGVYNSWRGRQG